MIVQQDIELVSAKKQNLNYKMVKQLNFHEQRKVMIRNINGILLIRIIQCHSQTELIK
jgi:hypothetical protein